MDVDARAAAIIAVVAVAPLAIVILVGLLRGYSVDLKATRDKPRRKKDEVEDE